MNHTETKVRATALSSLRQAFAYLPTVPQVIPVAYSIADQGFAIGGGFLVNVMLARTQSKEEYGMFVLSYSVFTLICGLYNAAIVEPYTVFGAGRYRDHLTDYFRLMLRTNVSVGVLLTALLLAAYVWLRWRMPELSSKVLVGEALAVSVLLTSTLVRRAFYVRHRPQLAVQTSFVFFITLAAGLALAARWNALDGFSAFLILAFGWIAGMTAFGRTLLFEESQSASLEKVSPYWTSYWKYVRWALATAAVFQFTTQGYYWLAAAFLSVKQVAELRATYLLVAPVEQVFIAISFLVLPGLAGHFAAARMESFFSLWKRNVLAVVGVTLSFALLVRIFGKLAMHFLYAGKFDGLAPLLYLLAFSPLFIGISGTMVNGLNALERPKLVFVGYLSSGCATFAFGTPLVIYLGLRGAVFGILLSGCTLATALGCVFFLAVSRQGVQAVVSRARTV